MELHDVSKRRKEKSGVQESVEDIGVHVPLLDKPLMISVTENEANPVSKPSPNPNPMEI